MPLSTMMMAFVNTTTVSNCAQSRSCMLPGSVGTVPRATGVVERYGLISQPPMVEWLDIRHEGLVCSGLKSDFGNAACISPCQIQQSGGVQRLYSIEVDHLSEFQLDTPTKAISVPSVSGIEFVRSRLALDHLSEGVSRTEVGWALHAAPRTGTWS